MRGRITIICLIIAGIILFSANSLNFSLIWRYLLFIVALDYLVIGLAIWVWGTKITKRLTFRLGRFQLPKTLQISQIYLLIARLKNFLSSTFQRLNKKISELKTRLTQKREAPVHVEASETEDFEDSDLYRWWALNLSLPESVREWIITIVLGLVIFGFFYVSFQRILTGYKDWDMFYIWLGWQ